MISTGRKRVTRKPGDFWLIKLQDNEFAFGRETSDSVAIYDLRSLRVSDLHVIEKARVLFRVPVMDYAMKSGRWQKIGHLPLDPALSTPAKFFMQDAFTGELSIYGGGMIRPATRDQCEGLECAAVWDPEHVEDRLRDHYNGMPNKWAQSLRMK